jgi:hypothetical protein
MHIGSLSKRNRQRGSVRLEQNVMDIDIVLLMDLSKTLLMG